MLPLAVVRVGKGDQEPAVAAVGGGGGDVLVARVLVCDVGQGVGEEEKEAGEEGGVAAAMGGGDGGCEGWKGRH